MPSPWKVAGGPTQLSRPMSFGHHISMEHRTREKYLQLKTDTNASNEIFHAEKESSKTKQKRKRKKSKKSKNWKKEKPEKMKAGVTLNGPFLTPFIHRGPKSNIH